MDPTLEAALIQYFNAEPAFASEYARLKASGATGNRSAAEWMYDHIMSSPGDRTKFEAMVKTGDPTGTENPGGDTVPLEQDLLERALQDYIYPDMAADAGRRAQAQDILNRYNGYIDEAINTNRTALDGSRLNDEYAMADETGTRMKAAIEAEAAGRGSALDKLNTDRLAALDPLAKERISAADTLVSGINQGLEGERDRIAAENGLAGFYGGSSMQDAALGRAAYGARQSAAETMGAAKVQNASDTRSIWDDTAKGKASSEFSRLDGVRTADQGVATDRKNYFDNDFTRRLQAVLTPVSLEANRLSVLGAADDYGQSGLRRGLNTLNWFSATPSQPQYSTYQQQASNAGNDIAALGSGLFSAGASLGMSKLGSTKKGTMTGDLTNGYTVRY